MGYLFLPYLTKKIDFLCQKILTNGFKTMFSAKKKSAHGVLSFLCEISANLSNGGVTHSEKLSDMSNFFPLIYAQVVWEINCQFLILCWKYNRCSIENTFNMLNTNIGNVDSYVGSILL